MPELTDYEIQYIRRYMESFSKTSSTVSRMLNTDYSEKLYRAKSALTTYSKQEEQALKAAQKQIGLVFGSSGGWSNGRNNINDIMKQNGQDCAEEIEKVFEQYSSEIRSMIKQLPQIGDYHSQHVVFDQTEYSGDIDYTETFGAFFTAGSSDESNHSDEPGTSVPGTDSETVISSGFSENSKVENRSVSTSYRSADTQTISESNRSSFESGGDETIDTFITDPQIEVLAVNSLSGKHIRKLVCSSISEIQANAFKGIQGLELIVLMNSIRVININAFRGLENKCIIAFADSKATIESRLSSTDGLNNRRVIFDYHAGDENTRTAEVFAASETTAAEHNKRTVIRKNTPLDSDEIKALFLSRNAGYELTMAELNIGISNANTNVEKDLILFEALKEKRKRDLQDNSFWNYAKTMQSMIKLCEKLGRVEDELDSIFALFFLDSSGYRMINGNYNPYMQDPSMMYYHPKMQMQNLAQIQEEKHYSEQELTEKYKNSPYVVELTRVIKNGYYSLETSIKMMLAAMQNPYTIYYPAQSRYKRIN